MRCLVILLALAGIAHADDKRGDCKAELDARHVAWKAVSRPGIAIAVEITGPLGGIALTSDDQPLVIDCSLAVSLDEAGHYLKELGIASVRGTSRTKHDTGLAIDVHAFVGPDVGSLRIDRDYEQGLGGEVDCVGAPLTQRGAVLKILQCQLIRSGLFHLVLSPDYDDAHRDHFHLEALPWNERHELRSGMPAIH